MGPQLEPVVGCRALEQYIGQFNHVRELPGGWWSESLALFEQDGVAMLNVFMNLFNDVAHSPVALLWDMRRCRAMYPCWAEAR